jgi:hypothetical protein
MHQAQAFRYLMPILKKQARDLSTPKLQLQIMHMCKKEIGRFG